MYLVSVRSHHHGRPFNCTERVVEDRRLAVGESPKIHALTLWRECNDQSHCRVDSPDRFNGWYEIRVWSDEDHMWWFWGRSAPMFVRPCIAMAVDCRVSLRSISAGLADWLQG